ncbi:unnamed protein product [Somion occarium]|uniref:Fe2OG dioxygenase domain-containing protein n=1 Tax=Somion occarium TaxID=3059160 RepID=A0ABP1CXA3_9APHY
MIDDGGEDEGEDEDEEGEEDEEELDIDVLEKLEAILSSNFQSTGTFAFKQAYPDAPNPVLKIHGLGTIGLPLSSRDAEAIKTSAEQAPFGMGERTVVDKTVRDTWEIDAKSVAFGSTRWVEFMADVVKSVCQTLGVNFAASAPRCELYKLLLYEKGSHFLPHVDTEKSNGMFATIVVVLPSEFTGGEAHLSHGGLSLKYDTSVDGASQTTVMAWYTDVMHEVKPVTSGYRLALSYNLIHTTTSLRPALSSNLALTDHLREILCKWHKDAGQSSHEKIVYLLDHKYSQANLRASALKGSDAQMVATLDLLAKDTGFHLGLAQAVCHLQGSADESGVGHSYYGRRRRGWYDEYDDEPDYDDVEFEEIETRETDIEHFVDMDGKLIASSLDFDEETETIPENIAEGVEDGDYENQEFEGYMGNYAGSLDRWYRRTVLVIWPDYNDCNIRFSGDNFKHALDSLSKMASVAHEPTAENLELASFVLSCHFKDPKRVLHAVCAAAIAWNDQFLWGQAIRDCGWKGFDVISDNELFQGIQKFGFEAVRPSMEHLLQKDDTNHRRLGFLTRLKAWVLGQQSEELKQDTSPWIGSKVELTVGSLKKPLPGDLELFIQLSVERGGISHLQDSIIPQIVPLTDPTLLKDFALLVHADARLPPSDVKTKVVSGLLSAALSSHSFNEASQPSTTYHSNFVTAKLYLQACFDTQCYDLTGGIINKVANGIAHPCSGNQLQYVKEVALPLLAFLHEYISKNPGYTPPYLDLLLQRAIDVYTTSMGNSVTKGEIQCLVQAVALDSSESLFANRILPKLLQLPLKAAELKDVFEELFASKNRIAFPANYSGPTIDMAVGTLARKFATVVSLELTQIILHTLEACMKVNAGEACSVIIKRIVDKSKLTANYITQVLIPLMPRLRELANRYRTLDHLAPAFQAIMLAWISKILGKRPDADVSSIQANLKRWPCGCQHCQNARALLAKAERSNQMHRIGAPARRHVEAYLSQYARGAATYDTVRSTPQGLQLTKSDVLFQHLRWKAEQAKGADILKTISTDEAELKRILGPHYDSITTLLRGQKVVNVHHAPQNMQPRAGSSTAAAVRSQFAQQTAPAIAQPTSVPGPSNFARPPAAQVPTGMVTPYGNVGGTSVFRIGSGLMPPTTQGSVGQPPAKKRRTTYNTDDVIDLT